MKAAVKKLLALAVALWLVLGAAAPALAVVQPTEEFYVADYAGVLSEHTKNYIIEKNDYLYDACGAQIVVVTVDDTDGLTLEEYGYQLANEWGIGSAEKDNGVLLLLSIGGDDYQCMQGAGLEDQLPTSTLSRILREDLEPGFSAGAYDGSVKLTFKALYRAVSVIYNVKNGAVQTEVPVASSTVESKYAARRRQQKQELVKAILLSLLLFGSPVLIALKRQSGNRAPARHWTAGEPEPEDDEPFFDRRDDSPRELARPDRPREESAHASPSYRSSSSRSTSSASFSSSSARSTPSSGGSAPRSGGGGSFRGGGAGRGH